MKNNYKTTNNKNVVTPVKRVWMVQLVSLLLFSSVMSCSKTPPCTAKDGHKWGEWVDQWEVVNDAGQMRQMRHCVKCNTAQSGLHK